MKTTSNADAPAPLRCFSPSRRRRVRTPVGGPSLTRQEFTEECDINKIVRRYQLTGAITHFARYSPQYGDFSPCDLQTARNLLKRAEELFAELPANIRAEFPTPEAFLTFVQNPQNAERMRALGLTTSEEAPTTLPSPSSGSEGA